MKIEIEIKDKDIVDALCTSLEGGSNYWYWIEELPEHFDSTISTSENISNWVLANPENKIEITDVETNEILGYLCKNNILFSLLSVFVFNQ